MKIEVLLSCMNQKDFSIVEKMNLTTDILIVNQCNENKYEERIINGKKQRMIYTTQRGLSHSRNELLNNMEGDIGILCDDDVVYEKDYENKIKQAYIDLEQAGIIIFEAEVKRDEYDKYPNLISVSTAKIKNKKYKKAPKNKYYTSTRITFKKKSIQNRNIWFNLNFGAGSKYSSGEEGIFLREARNKGIKIYECYEKLANVHHKNSTWFTGFNEKFFKDKGAWLKEVYPNINFIFKWYYIIKFGGKNFKKIIQIYRWINNGIKEYKNWKK